mmetsp:Transcript_14077/g.33460  ORF Transcript_14077/g.33460 Transcript_14077/m.33460 type:complete len:609 (+) Transcript_14077:72-1898(+)
MGAACSVTVAADSHEGALEDLDLLNFPMKFPMWLIAGRTLMELRPPLLSHEQLKKQGKLIQWKPAGQSRPVVFISHEWVGTRHPDPEFKQFKVLQAALRNMSDGKLTIRKEPISELLGIPLPVPSVAEQHNCLDWYFWYDYISCPQLSVHGDPDASMEEINASRADLQDAVASIPAYCEKADFLLVLAPSLRHSDAGRVMSSCSWSNRGWCRVERTATVCSRSAKSLLILSSPQQLLLSAGPDWVTSWPGQGMFTVEQDREMLQELTGRLLQMKSEHLMTGGDQTNWRFFQALQPKARGQATFPEREDVGQFRQRYRLPPTGGVHGMSPLMLASLEGNCSVMSQLLEAKADVDEPVAWRFPQAHIQGRVLTALFFAAALSTEEAVSTLLDARASLELPSGISKAGIVVSAAYFGNSSVLPLLLERRGDMNALTNLGGNALFAACGTSNFESTRILLQNRADPNRMNYAGGTALSFNCLFNTSPRHAELLLEARADPNLRGVPANPLWSGICWVLKQMTRSRNPSAVIWNLALSSGGTPLHFAALNGNLEVAQILLDSMADLNATWGDERLTPLHLARGQGHEDLVACLEVEKRPRVVSQDSELFEERF